MNSREIVERTIRFEWPERIAMSLPSPYPNDFAGAGIAADPNWKPKRWREGTMELWTDEWGVVWGRVDQFSKGEVVRGVIESWDQLDDYQPPRIDAPERFQHAAEVFRQHPDKFKIGHLPGFPFNIARKLRRLEHYLMDVAMEPEKVVALNRKVRDVLEGAIVQHAKAGADGIMFCEDWGTQDRLLINPAMWKEMFKPDFVHLCRVAHEHGLFVLMHSCGFVLDIIEDLIDAGINVLQFDQPELMGIDVLADRFAGRVTFWCPVDIQKTLQTKDPERIRASAKKMIERFGEKGGGFIAGYYGANEAIGITPEIQDIACKAFVEFGTYKRTQ